MADLTNRGGAARNGSCDSGLASLMDVPDGRRPGPPKLMLTLSMPAASKPGDDPSSSSGENYFRGFRLQFPGFSKRDLSAADCSDGDERRPGRRVDDDDDDDEGDEVGGRRDESFEGIPDTPSPVLQVNKKRLYHVPAMLKNPTGANKKLRLEEANGGRPASPLPEADASDEGAATAAAASNKPEASYSDRRPVDVKLPMLRVDSEDAGGHVLDETLATFHKIVADTSKIMEKLCTDRKAAAAPAPEDSDVGVSCEPREIGEMSKVLAGGDVPAITQITAANEPKILRESSDPVVALAQGSKEDRKGEGTSDGRGAEKDAVEKSEPKERGNLPMEGAEEPSLLGVERFRSGGSDATPVKSARPPSFHWPSPGSGSLKVAVVSPLLSSNAEQHGGGGSKPDKAGPSQSRDGDGRSGRIRPAAHRSSRRDCIFAAGSRRISSSSSSSSDSSGGYTAPPPPKSKALYRLIDYSSDSNEEEQSLASLRRAMDRSGGGKEVATSRNVSKQQQRGSRGRRPLNFSYSSDEGEEEKVGGSKRGSRLPPSSLRDLATSPRWRMTAAGQQDAPAAFLLEEMRGARTPAAKAATRRRLRTPREWDVLNSSSDSDSDLEVLSHVKPTRTGGKPPTACTCGSKDSAAKDKRKYHAFPAAGEAYLIHRPGTSRAFDERPTCVHQRPSCCKHQDASSSRSPQDSGPRVPKSKTHPSKSRSGRGFLRRLDIDLFDQELSSDEDGGGVLPPPPRQRRPVGLRASARRVARIISSSSETEVDEAAVHRPRERRPPAARFGEARAASASPVFNSSPLLDVEGDADSPPLAPGGYRSSAAAGRRTLDPLLERLDSPGEMDAVHRIEQIETDEAYARRLQAEFDAEATATVAAVVPPPPPAANAVPSERGFTPGRAGPSAPHRYSRNRNPSPRMVNSTGGIRTNRPRQASARSPSQQSLLNASRHRSNGGRMRGATSYDGMTTAAMLPMLDSGHFNRMLLGFQDEWMSLIASVAVPNIESDPEETSRGRSPRSLRRRPAARANASSDDTDIDGITFESLLTYSDDEDDYWQAGLRQAANQTGRTGARRRSRGRRAHGNYWTPNQGNDYEELLELAERLGHVSRGLNRTQINRLPTHLFSKAAAGADGGNGRSEGATRTTECHICMSEYENGERLRILPCFHDFHTNCIDRWLREKNTCPVCRLRVQVS